MGLLKPAKNETAFAKIGIMGFAGSGKTFTATRIIAKELAKISNKKQIAFFDTEKGSDFLVKPLEAEGFELLRVKSKSFVNLLDTIREAEKEGIPLVIDSITHVWRELCDSYQKKYGKKSLNMYDWGILKGQWWQFTDLYINSKCHIVMCGRAGFEYETSTNEDTGKQEMVKAGTKMRVEGETGFEPDLLLEMDRVELKDKIVNRCYVLKDRSDTLNGKTIDSPKFSDFKTFFEFINIGGEHVGFNSDNSQSLFEDPDRSYEQMKKQREIAIEELQSLLIKLDLSGTSKEAAKARVELLESIFKTSSKTAIETLKLSDLLEGISKIKEMVNKAKEEVKKEMQETKEEAKKEPEQKETKKPSFKLDKV